MKSATRHRLAPDRFTSAMAVALVLATVTTPWCRGGDPPPVPEPDRSTVLIHYEPGRSEEARRAARESGLEVVYDYTPGSFLKCRVPNIGSAAAAVTLVIRRDADTPLKGSEMNAAVSIPPFGTSGQSLQPRPFTDSPEARKNLVCQITVQSRDPLLAYLWNLQAIRVPPRWTESGAGWHPVIAVLDTGVDYDHEDLKANMWVNPGEGPMPDGKDNDGNGIVDDIHGADFTQRDADGLPFPVGDPLDDHGHGTHIAGTIAAVSNNDKGVVGVCPQAHIMALKVMNAQGKFNSIDAAVYAIDYAIKNGASIINCSWVIRNPPPAPGQRAPRSLEMAFERAARANVLVVTAAGNEEINIDTTWYQPACIDRHNVVAVLAVDPGEKRAEFSNYGKQRVDIAGPGGRGDNAQFDSENIFSTLPGNLYGFSYGTSMAAPHVTAVAAAVRSVDPAIPVADLKDLLTARARGVMPLKPYCRSAGIVDLGAIIAELNRVESINTAKRLKVGYRGQEGAPKVRALVEGLGLSRPQKVL